MARITPFSIGQRWYCVQTNPSSIHRNFTFLIIGAGEKPNEKLCRLVYDDPNDSHNGIEQPYTHKHLKKYAKLVTC